MNRLLVLLASVAYLAHVGDLSVPVAAGIAWGTGAAALASGIREILRNLCAFEPEPAHAPTRALDALPRRSPQGPLGYGFPPSIPGRVHACPPPPPPPPTPTSRELRGG